MCTGKDLVYGSTLHAFEVTSVVLFPSHYSSSVTMMVTKSLPDPVSGLQLWLDDSPALGLLGSGYSARATVTSKSSIATACQGQWLTQLTGRAHCCQGPGHARHGNGRHESAMKTHWQAILERSCALVVCTLSGAGRACGSCSSFLLLSCCA